MPSANDSLNRIYADEMRNHPYGYALFQPVFTSVIKPGMAGYFDKDGIWSPLADLTDLASLKAAGLKPPHPLTRAPEQKERWGPLTSKSVSGHNLDTSTAPAITGLPITASLKVKYTSNTNFGAILITTTPVTHHSFYYSSPFSGWVRDNAHALLSGPNKEDIHDNGLVVITQTYSTSKADLTAWTDSNQEVFLGFDGALPGVGKGDESGGWKTGNSASGWMEYPANDKDEVVVFVGGLWYDAIREGIGAIFDTATTTLEKVAGEGAAPGVHERVPIETPQGEKYHMKGRMFGRPLPHDHKA